MPIDELDVALEEFGRAQRAEQIPETTRAKMRSQLLDAAAGGQPQSAPSGGATGALITGGAIVLALAVIVPLAVGSNRTRPKTADSQTSRVETPPPEPAVEAAGPEGTAQPLPPTPPVPQDPPPTSADDEPTALPLPPPKPEPDPKPKPPPRAQPQADPLAREVELLNAAQSALRAGKAKTALARVKKHAKEFPDGELAESREIARVRALCELGDHDAARASYDAFRRDWPASQRLRSLPAGCEGEK